MNCEAECEKYECAICMDFRDQFAKTLQKARTLYDQQVRHQVFIHVNSLTLIERSHEGN